VRVPPRAFNLSCARALIRTRSNGSCLCERLLFASSRPVLSGSPSVKSKRNLISPVARVIDFHHWLLPLLDFPPPGVVLLFDIHLPPGTAAPFPSAAPSAGPLFGSLAPLFGPIQPGDWLFSRTVRFRELNRACRNKKIEAPQHAEIVGILGQQAVRAPSSTTAFLACSAPANKTWRLRPSALICVR